MQPHSINRYKVIHQRTIGKDWNSNVGFSLVQFNFHYILHKVFFIIFPLI